MRFDRGNQQVRVAGSLIVDFVSYDDLVLHFLQFDHFAEFGRLARLTPRFREGRLLRMTSVDGSKRLTILPSAWVSPARTRALVWRITCRTRGIVARAKELIEQASAASPRSWIAHYAKANLLRA